MNFAELISAVYSVTNRPDRSAETSLAIQAATLKMHQTDFYAKDLHEVGVAFDVAAYLQQLDYKALLPRWRAPKYLRKYDPTTDTGGTFMYPLTPEGVLDEYGSEKTDIFYMAGAFMQIKSSTAIKDYLLGYYRHPDITPGGFNSWVAEECPFAIVFDAAATVFKAIGKDEEAAAYRGLIAEQVAIMKLGNISTVGF